jgi:plasmid stabilization system protein ParE
MQGRVEAATRLVDSITELFFVLGRQPRAGRRRDDFQPGTRTFPAGNYIIYYRPRKGGIDVSHVIHAKRDQRAAWEGKS